MPDEAIALPIYRRDGTPIASAEEWARLLADHAYQCVGTAVIGPWRVSTVWLGLDHNLCGGRPHIFETMVFDQDDASRCCRRYTTEAEARDGHAALVAYLAGGGTPEAYGAD